MKKKSEVCKTCRFWRQSESAEAVDSDMGQCHRYPNMTAEKSSPSAITVMTFPNVPAWEWCGEWRDKDRDPREPETEERMPERGLVHLKNMAILISKWMEGMNRNTEDAAAAFRRICEGRDAAKKIANDMLKKLNEWHQEQNESRSRQ